MGLPARGERVAFGDRGLSRVLEVVAYRVDDVDVADVDSVHRVAAAVQLEDLGILLC